VLNGFVARGAAPILTAGRGPPRAHSATGTASQQ